MYSKNCRITGSRQKVGIFSFMVIRETLWGMVAAKQIKRKKEIIRKI